MPDEPSPGRDAPATILGRALAFLDSPRLAMRAVLDSGSVWTVLPLAGVWGMIPAASKAAILVPGRADLGETLAILAGALLSGSLVGNVSCLAFATLVWLAGSWFRAPVRFRQVYLVVGWSAVPQLAMVPVMFVYYGFVAFGILDLQEPLSFSSHLAAMIVMLLGAVLEVCSVAICVTGLSVASGLSRARSAVWFAFAATLGFGLLLGTVPRIVRLLT
jgi:hypothetical protein